MVDQAPLTQTVPSAQPPHPRRSWIGLFLLLVVVIAAVFAWIYWQPQRTIIAVSKNYVHWPIINSSAEQPTLAALSERVDTLQQNVNQLMQRNTTDEGWILSEVQYSIRLAVYHLQMDRNVANAIVLLQTADQQASQLKNMPIHQALLQAISALQAVPQVDIDNMIAQLAALNQLIIKLPQVNPQMQKVDMPIDTTKYSIWQRVWHELKSVIIIRKVDDQIAPLLNQDQRENLNQHLMMLLTQAQWAVLHHDQTVYLLSLQQIENFVVYYFGLNQAATKQVLDSLHSLQQQNVDPAMPDLNPLLKIFPLNLSTAQNITPVNLVGK